MQSNESCDMLDIISSDAVELIMKMGGLELRAVSKKYLVVMPRIAKTAKTFDLMNGMFENVQNITYGMNDVSLTRGVCAEKLNFTNLRANFPSAEVIVLKDTTIRSGELKDYRGALVLIGCVLGPSLVFGGTKLVMKDCRVRGCGFKLITDTICELVTVSGLRSTSPHRLDVTFEGTNHAVIFASRHKVSDLIIRYGSGVLITNFLICEHDYDVVQFNESATELALSDEVIRADAMMYPLLGSLKSLGISQPYGY